MDGYWYMWIVAALGVIALVGLVVVDVKRATPRATPKAVLKKCPECRRVSKVSAVHPSSCPRCGWELTHVAGRAPVPLWTSPLVIAALAVTVYGISGYAG